MRAGVPREGVDACMRARGIGTLTWLGRAYVHACMRAGWADIAETAASIGLDRCSGEGVDACKQASGASGSAGRSHA